MLLYEKYLTYVVYIYLHGVAIMIYFKYNLIALFFWAKTIKNVLDDNKMSENGLKIWNNVNMENENIKLQIKI